MMVVCFIPFLDWSGCLSLCCILIHHGSAKHLPHFSCNIAQWEDSPLLSLHHSVFCSVCFPLDDVYWNITHTCSLERWDSCEDFTFVPSYWAQSLRFLGRCLRPISVTLAFGFNFDVYSSRHIILDTQCIPESLWKNNPTSLTTDNSAFCILNVTIVIKVYTM